VNEAYPVFTETSTFPNFIENQELIVHNYSYSIDDRVPNVKTTKTVSTVCRTNDDQTTTVRCISESSKPKNYIKCSGNKSFFCGDVTRNCNKEVNIKCNFSNNSNVQKSTIQADISMNFSDRYEDQKLRTLVFKVKNCSWVYDRTLTN
jgi:hypothetical protein